MSDLHAFEGHLTDYYETGMETLGLILQDNRGVTPNPQYDATKTGYPFDIPFWHSLNYCVFFRGGEEIEVYAADGTVEYKGPLTKDRALMAEKKYRYAFLPKEVPFDTWISWFVQQRKAKAWSKEPPIAEDPRYKK